MVMGPLTCAAKQFMGISDPRLRDASAGPKALGLFLLVISIKGAQRLRGQSTGLLSIGDQ